MHKALWPGLWDVTAGGHVQANELGYQAVIRETKEELGIDINKNDLEFIGSTLSENIQGLTINRHFNEFYVVHKDVNIEDIILDEEEVEDIKWFETEEVIERINNNYDDLTDKINFYLNNLNIAQMIAVKGRRNAASNFSYNDRLKGILKVIYGKNFSSR